MKYGIDSIRNAIDNPWLIRRELNLLGTKINQYWYDKRNRDPNNILDESWDTLIILDALRADVFDKKSSIAGKYRRISAPGSNSLEFLRFTFANRELYDTVYVTANPHVSAFDDQIFHEIEMIESIQPADVTEAALDAHSKFPNKRIIVHYMQPHEPYIGEFGSSLPHSCEFGDDIWTAVMCPDCEVNIDDVNSAYEENLDVVLSHLKPLLNEIDGQIAISADHGEMLGERQSPIPVRGYGHYPQLHCRELIEVPLLTIEADVRRDIFAEEPTHSDVPEATKHTLELLGYQ